MNQKCNHLFKGIYEDKDIDMRETENGPLRCGDKGTLLNSWGECKLVRPLWRTGWRFFKKLKMKLSYDLAIPLLGMYLEKTVI